MVVSEGEQRLSSFCKLTGVEQTSLLVHSIEMGGSTWLRPNGGDRHCLSSDSVADGGGRTGEVPTLRSGHLSGYEVLANCSSLAGSHPRAEARGDKGTRWHDRRGRSSVDVHTSGNCRVVEALGFQRFFGARRLSSKTGSAGESSDEPTSQG